MTSRTSFGDGEEVGSGVWGGVNREERCACRIGIQDRGPGGEKLDLGQGRGDRTDDSRARGQQREDE